MIFLLGIIIGLLVAILIVATLTYFRRVIEKQITIVRKQIENAGPRPKGYIIEPPSEVDDMREEIIEKNRQQGRDTPISELM